MSFSYDPALVTARDWVRLHVGDHIQSRAQLQDEEIDALVAECRSHYAQVATGEFGADMQVSLTNDGPVTFWLEVAPGAGLSS